MSKVNNLGEKSSLAGRFLYELREVSLQKDRKRFRDNLYRLGEIGAYEISKTLIPAKVRATTPLGVSECQFPSEDPVLLTVLRAGVPLLDGVLSLFDRGDVGFLGEYRVESGEGVKAELKYSAIPSVQDRVVILADPMLATGSSLIKALKFVLDHGTPKEIHVLSVISSEEGIKNLLGTGIDLTLWTFGIDPELDSNSFIVPGLGDAGDLSFGSKDF